MHLIDKSSSRQQLLRDFAESSALPDIEGITAEDMLENSAGRYQMPQETIESHFVHLLSVWLHVLSIILVVAVVAIAGSLLFLIKLKQYNDKKHVMHKKLQARLAAEEY